MAFSSFVNVASLIRFLIILPVAYSSYSYKIPGDDVDLVEFPLNLEFLEAEFFLYGTYGYGLDKVAPNLTKGGPPPVGGRRAHLDPLTRDIIMQFAWQEVGHLRFCLIGYLYFLYMFWLLRK